MIDSTRTKKTCTLWPSAHALFGIDQTPAAITRTLTEKANIPTEKSCQLTPIPYQPIAKTCQPPPLPYWLMAKDCQPKAFPYHLFPKACKIARNLV
jgi:hypothetical protein